MGATLGLWRFLFGVSANGPAAGRYPALSGKMGVPSRPLSRRAQ